MSTDVYSGPAVLDGLVRFGSVSAFELADVSRDGGCLRKWWYRYVARIREPQTAQQAEGTEGHAQIAEYLTTGRDVLGPIARTARHLLPKPGPDLEIEAELCPVKLERIPLQYEHDLGAAPLRLAGIPLIGAMDVRHRRGYRVGGLDISDTQDPPGTVEIADHKFTSRPDLAKSPDQLRRSIQMVGYAEHSRVVYPELEYARLSHHVINTRKREPARKVTVRVPMTEIAATWRSFEPLARQIQATARAARADDVPANTAACDAFRGCFYRNQCSASQSQQLVKLFGIRRPTQGIPIMSLLDDIPPDTVSAAPAAPPPPSDAFVEAMKYLDAAAQSYGYPKMIGQAAVWRAALQGKSIPLGASLPGEGRLAGREYDADKVVQLGAELKGAGVTIKVATPPPVKDVAVEVGLLPPDATVPAAIVPPNTPPAVADMTTAIADAVQAQAAAEKTPRKARAPKVDAPGDVVKAAAIERGDLRAPAPEVVILADAYTHGAASLDALVAGWAASVAAEAKIDDVRLANGDHPLAFGKWRGFVAALSREGIAALAPGWYTLDTRSDFGALALEAAAGLAGVRVVRGAR